MESKTATVYYTLYTLPRVLGARATTICPMTSAVRVAIDTEGQETIFERNYKQKYVAQCEG